MREPTAPSLSTRNGARIRQPKRNPESVALQHNRRDLQQLSYLDLFKDFYEQYRAIEMEESGQKR